MSSSPKRTKPNPTRPRLGSFGDRLALLELDDPHRPRSRSRSHGDVRLITSVLRLVEQQTARATAVEQTSKTEIDTLLSCARELTEGRLKAQMEVAGVRAELEMYKRQFAEAQRGWFFFYTKCFIFDFFFRNPLAEIHRAQDIFDRVERARLEDEEAWARDRARLRELELLRTVEAAKEEGRRQGLKEGLEHGRWLASRWAGMSHQEVLLAEDGLDEGYELRRPIRTRCVLIIESKTISHPP